MKGIPFNQREIVEKPSVRWYKYGLSKMEDKYDYS